MREDDVQALEEKCLEFLLVGKTEELSILRRQVKVARRDREGVGPVGWVSSFHLPDTCPRLQNKTTITISDVVGFMKNLDGPFSPFLLIRNGLIDYFEICTYQGNLPTCMGTVELKYVDKSGTEVNERDLQSLESILSVQIG